MRLCACRVYNILYTADQSDPGDVPHEDGETRGIGVGNNVLIS